jgi:hypothetical protein
MRLDLLNFGLRTQRGLDAARAHERGRGDVQDSGGLLLSLEPGRHFMPRKIDALVDAPAFGEAKPFIMAPAP